MAKLEIPEDWEATAETILDAEWRKVFLLGAADVGKSSFYRFLSERLLAAGHDVVLVDADTRLRRADVIAIDSDGAIQLIDRRALEDLGG